MFSRKLKNSEVSVAKIPKFAGTRDKIGASDISISSISYKAVKFLLDTKQIPSLRNMIVFLLFFLATFEVFTFTKKKMFDAKIYFHE